MPVQRDRLQGITLKQLLDLHVSRGGSPYYEPFMNFLWHGCLVCGRGLEQHVEDKCLFDNGTFVVIPPEASRVFQDWFDNDRDGNFWTTPLSVLTQRASQMDRVEILSGPRNSGGGEGTNGPGTDWIIPSKAV
jgi:hypothetical protein